MTRDERKSLLSATDDLIRALEECLSLASMVHNYKVTQAVWDAKYAAQEHRDALIRDGQQYSDSRPLDAKTIPGAHGAYR